MFHGRNVAHSLIAGLFVITLMLNSTPAADPPTASDDAMVTAIVASPVGPFVRNTPPDTMIALAKRVAPKLAAPSEATKLSAVLFAQGIALKSKTSFDMDDAKWDALVTEMIDTLTKAIKADPTNRRAKFAKAAFLAYHRHNYDDLPTLLNDYPKDARILALHALCSAHEDRPKLIDQAVRATAGDPEAEAIVAYHQAVCERDAFHFSESIAAYDRALAGCEHLWWLVSPERLHSSRALVRAGFGDNEGAASDISDYLKLHPKDALALTLLWETCIRTGREQEALALMEMRKVCGVDQKSPIRMLAASWSRTGRYAEVIKLLEPIEAVDDPMRIELAIAYHLKGDRAAALQTVIAIPEGPGLYSYPPTRYVKAMLVVDDAKPNTKLAVKLLDDAANAHRDFGPVDQTPQLVARMIVAAAAKDYDNAIKVADKALKCPAVAKCYHEDIAKARAAYQAGKPFPPTNRLLKAVYQPPIFALMFMRPPPPPEKLDALARPRLGNPSGDDLLIRRLVR